MLAGHAAARVQGQVYVHRESIPLCVEGGAGEVGLQFRAQGTLLNHSTASGLSLRFTIMPIPNVSAMNSNSIYTANRNALNRGDV